MATFPTERLVRLRPRRRGQARVVCAHRVHGSSIGQAAVAEAPIVATHGDKTATVTRWMEDIEAPPFWARQIHHGVGYEGRVDRWQIIKFEAPATINIDVGVAQAASGAVPKDGRPGDRIKGVNGYVLNTVTPETDKTCLYFWAFARNYSFHDQRAGSMWMRRLIDKMIASESGTPQTKRVIAMRSIASS
jgi:hypothetical protein